MEALLVGEVGSHEAEMVARAARVVPGGARGEGGRARIGAGASGGAAVTNRELQEGVHARIVHPVWPLMDGGGPARFVFFVFLGFFFFLSQPSGLGKAGPAQ